MVFPSDVFLADVRDAFLSIGYRNSLLLSDYPFADVSEAAYSVREIPLAAFAQAPPSYRNACAGVALVDREDAAEVGQYRSLGAPQIFTVDAREDRVGRWKIRAEGLPDLLEQISLSSLPARIRSEREAWGPEHIFRAKSAVGYIPPVQLDFYDLGLLPVLEQEVHTKLDTLLRTVLSLGMSALAQGHSSADPYQVRQLYRLVFRLLAAKLLADRQYPGDWLLEDVDRVIEAVEAFYFSGAAAAPEPAIHSVRQRIWNEMRASFHLQNLSVEALAYVYENTLVSPETRAEYGTHATPPEVAQFVVNSLPFERLDPWERVVFEPFAGHAPFLIASLSRLKRLLGDQVNPEERHTYFVHMLRGVEIDSFAAEVAKYSLMLADYPNPDGWQIDIADAFSSPVLSEHLRQARIVLSNPPYESFNPRKSGCHANKAVEAVNRILAHPPAMLGLVIPRVFIDGQSFRSARRRLIDVYGEIQMTVLPDIAFRHSESETVAVLASHPESDTRTLVSQYVEKRDYQDFVRHGTPTWTTRKVGSRLDQIAPGQQVEVWHTPLAPIWERLQSYRTLGSLLRDSSRGIEYSVSVREHRAELTSKFPRHSFHSGVFSARGLEPYVPPAPIYICVEPNLMRGRAYLKPWSEPKILTNAHRLGRGPWTLAAVIDRSGLVGYQNVQGLWLRFDVELEVIAAILNSPVANAFLYTYRTSRHNRLSDLRRVPVPPLSEANRQEIVSLVRAYEGERSDWISDARMQIRATRCREILSAIDVMLLRAYDFSPQEERDLLDIFTGFARPGPVQFTEYFPRSFRPAIPWAEYISPRFTEASARATLSRLPEIDDPSVSAVMRELSSLI